MARAKKQRGKVQFCRPNIDRIPLWYRGVYGFWCRDNGKCIYIGKAKDQPIRARLRGHWLSTHNRKLKLWIDVFGKSLDICYLPLKPDRIDKMEATLIRMWHPETNIIQPKR